MGNRRHGCRPVLWLLAAGFLAAGGCGRPGPLVFAGPEGVRIEAVEALLARYPLAPGENIRAEELGRGAAASHHLVQIARGESPHRHLEHDGTVIVLRGRGTLHLEDGAVALRSGAVVHIPRGMAHHFVNEGRSPAAALVVFTPTFDGRDVIPAADEQHAPR